MKQHTALHCQSSHRCSY